MTGESPETVKRACCPRDSRKTKSSPLRNEAQLNCVSLRSEFDYEVTWGAVKGQDERPCETPLTAPHVTPGVLCIAEKIIRMAATSALDFFDLLIEVRGGRSGFSAKQTAQLGTRPFDVLGNRRGNAAAATSWLTISVREQQKNADNEPAEAVSQLSRRART